MHAGAPALDPRHRQRTSPPRPRMAPSSPPASSAQRAPGRSSCSWPPRRRSPSPRAPGERRRASCHGLLLASKPRALGFFLALLAMVMCPSIQQDHALPHRRSPPASIRRSSSTSPCSCFLSSAAPVASCFYRRDPSTTRVPCCNCFLSLDCQDAAPRLFMIAAKFHLGTTCAPMIRRSFIRTPRPDPSSTTTPC